MDNSWANLTLSEKWFNNEKGNQTPYEYFQKRPEHERIAFRERVQIFPKAKREKFLAANIEQDFNPNQLTDTAYIARYARGLLHKICLKVEPTIGGTTAFLREKWQLDSLLAPKKRVEQIIKEQNEGLVVKMSKNRGDHRHHAVDALVIALTDIRYVQILSRDSQFNNGKFDNPKIPKEPWKEFKLQVGDFLKGLYISHRSKNRLIQKRALKKKDKNAPKSYSTAIRGQLHKETFYGARKFPHHFSKKFAFGEEVFEERKALEALKDKDLDAILDLKVRQQIEAYAAQYNKGKVEGAFVNLKENPLWMYSTKGAKVPIKKVRLAFKASSLIEVHPKTFVESGDNYVLGIYRSDDGKITEVELVKFFEAVKRKKAGSAILPSHKTKKGQQLPLVYTLHKGDMFILYEEHEDAIEWNNPAYLLRRLYKVSIVAKNGAVATIYLVHHRSARPNEYTPQPVPEGKTDLGKPKVYRGSGNFKGVPVRIDRLGNIVRLSDGKVIKGGGQ
jgi:CRISPR-associated endonuclease Csn1